MFRRRNLPSNARTSRARSIYARECDAAFPFATSHIKARIKILFSSSAQKSSFLPSWLKNETIGIVLKARDWCSKSPSRIPTRTERNENNNAFAYLGGDFRGSNGRSSQRKHFVFVQVCVCVDMISNEVIFDLAAAFVKRDQNERKKRSSELVKNTRRKILDGGDGSIIALLSLDHHRPHLLIFKSS